MSPTAVETVGTIKQATTYEMFRDRLHAGAWGTGGREVSEERRLPEG